MASYDGPMEDPWAILRRAAADRDSGASEIARQAASALRVIPRERVPGAVRLLVQGHPAMAPLWRLASDVLSALDPATGAGAFLEQLARDEAAAAVVSRVLPDSVLTISFSSSVARAIELRRPARTLCMRSDPGGEGERMADLVSAWTQVQVVDDERALAEVPAEAVVTGADALTPEAVVNKVKTRALAVAARRNAIPCYAVAGRTKLVDRELPLIGPFEPTPLDLFTRLGFPDGLRSPEEAAAEARAASLHPGLQPLLDEFGRG